MKKLIVFLFSLLFVLPVAGQELVVRIDDMGALHSVNKACVETYQLGIATTVEVLVVGPWFPEAVKLLAGNPGLDAGVHLAITSEWENMKWRPLTDCPSLVDEMGYFYPMMFPNPAYEGLSLMERKVDIADVEKEFRAQIELALKYIPGLSHISGHMFSTAYSPEVRDLMLRLSAEYGLPCLDTATAGSDYGFEPLGYSGPKSTSAEKEASFIASLRAMEPGKTYLFLDHPAYDDCEMEGIFHVGYEDVSADREGVRDILVSPAVKAVIEQMGVKLVSAKEVLGKR